MEDVYKRQDGSFVNRGFLHGPWLPIYGSGSILILTPVSYTHLGNTGIVIQ